MRNIILILIIVLAALTRLQPDLSNFTPIISLGLFGAAYFRKDKFSAFLLPMGAWLLGDIIMELMGKRGFHSGTWTVYLTVIAVILFGKFILKKVSLLNVALASIGGSIIFFLITNFAFFYPQPPAIDPLETYYTHDLSGIISSYSAALPFFRTSLVRELFYSGLLFGVFELAKRFYKPLQTV